MLVSTFAIDHFELFGLNQALRAWRDRPAAVPRLKVPFLYRFVRHPMHAGVVVVCWATPTMTIGHLLFAVLMTAYIVAGSELEERDLLHLFGDAYRRYRRSTPRLVPLPWQRGPARLDETEDTCQPRH